MTIGNNTPAVVPLFMTISLDELDAHLFKCADIIRNTVDKTDYKDFILPLVFYKTISDTYEDQYRQNIDEYGDEEIARRPVFYDFVVPEEYSWDELRSQNKNVDEFINEAFEALSEANEGKLDSVFRADYVATDALGDDKLISLVEHLSTYDLSIEQVPPASRPTRGSVHGFGQTLRQRGRSGRRGVL
jgi:type I restriction enzyme M protein